MKHLKIFDNFEISDEELQNMFDIHLHDISKIHPEIKSPIKNSENYLKMLNKFIEKYKKNSNIIEEETKNIEKLIITPYEKFKSTRLQPEQQKIIQRYKNWGYDAINSFLRYGEKSTSDNIENIIQIFDSCFKQETHEKVYVLRIVEKEDIENEYFEKAYLSTSTSLEYIEENIDNFEDALIMHIEIPAGIKYVKPLVYFEDFEKEIIFQRNLKLKKISSDNDFVKYKIVI